MAQSPQNGYYEVAVGKRAVYVRIHGLASMNNCMCVRDFIEQMLAEGHMFVVMDFVDCTGMDSTFMGVLAGAATFERDGKTPGLAAVNASEAILRLLKSVGLTELIFIDPEPFKMPDIEFARLEEQPTEEERLALIHSAHEQLIKICEHNEKVFGPLVAVLESEMRSRGMKTGD